MTHSYPGALPRLAALLLGMGGLLSCDTTSPSSGGRDIYKVERISGDGATAEVGSLLDAPVVRVTAQGRPLANVIVEWSADADGSASDTRTDGSGYARAAWVLGPRPGPQHVTAGLGAGVAGTVTFTATAVAGGVGRLLVQPETGSLATVRDSLMLTASAADRFGNALPQPPLTWSSLDPAAWVSTGGVVHGVTGGTARIVVASAGVADTATVQVHQDPSQLTIFPPVASFPTLGRSFTFSVDVQDAFGNYMPQAAVSWSSLAPGVATVAGNGRVTAVADGTARILARAGVAVDTATVTVAQVPLYLTLSPAADTLFLGDSLRINALAADSLRWPAPNAELTWFSGDTTIATVDETGWVHAVRLGQATIRVAAVRGDPWANFVVTVAARPEP